MVAPMIRGDVAWPDGVPPFAGHVLVTDLEWEGDPEPFLDLFYPYGVREEALVE